MKREHKIRSVCHFGLILLFISLVTSCMKENKYTGIDKTDMDLSVQPGTDFYQFANGGWMQKNPLKPEYSRYGTFDKLQEENLEALRKLTEKMAKTAGSDDPVAAKIGLFLKTGMDTAAINQAGIKPLEPLLKQIEGIKSREEVKEFLISMHAHSISPLFNIFAEADSKNSRWMLAWLWQGGLGMPDRDYYLEDNARMKEIREKYLDYITTIFTLSGKNEKEAREAARLIFDLETQLAKASMSRLAMRDPDNVYHKMSLAQLQKEVPQISWKRYFEGIGVTDPGEVNVAQPDFFKAAGELLNKVPVETWKLYFCWNVLNESAPYVSEPFEQAHFAFYGKTMSGKEEMQPRWKRVLNTASYALGEAIGEAYVKEYFPPEAKQRMLTLVENLRKALGERIQNLTWMSDTTKQKALEKLAAMKVKIGYPDKWRDYSELKVGESSYIENVIEAERFNRAYMLSKVNKPVDPMEWHMTPQTVNAYYNPSNNEIVFPAGILQPPFFSMTADDAVNYGAIGMVIGHEMTHGFDDEGRKFDKDGNLSEWWTPEDAKRFNERTEILVKQYDQYVVLDSTHANGKLTLGENIADLGGLNVAYTAFKMTEEGKSNTRIDGFTPDQRFFLGYAHVWAQNIRDQEILRRTKEDVHSLGRFRVNGPLRNMPEFYKSFDIKPGDPMYLPEEERAVIW